jgi:Zn2+/Cd2+-exporting ATPase
MMERTADSKIFRIEGMDCAEETAILRREVGPLVGGEDKLVFDILNGTMSVLSSSIDSQAVVDRVAKTGMKATLTGDEKGADEHNLALYRGLLTAISGAFGLKGFVAHARIAGSFGMAVGGEGVLQAHAVPFASKAFYAVGIAAGVWMVLPKAWFALKSRRPDMNLLMTIAVIGAVGIGEWLEAATVSFLFALSLLLESWSIARARRAVAALMSLAPETARVRQPDGSWKEIPSKEAALESVFLIKPGERIPLDGVILQGTSSVNQAPITGESIPVAKEPGATVYAGTINGNGSLEVRSTKAAGDTTLAHIIKMVGAAQGQRAPAEQWVERFARVYTPVVFVVAILIALVPLVTGGGWEEWIYRALSLLVIGCPCALVISTPVSVVAGLTAAAKNGVLVKGGMYLELPARLRAVAVDKTGTLTEGRPVVAEVIAMDKHTPLELLATAAALESHSEHPLAKAILEHAKAGKVSVPAVSSFEIIPGKGAAGVVNGQRYWLGSHRYLEERKQETVPVHEKLEALSKAGRTVVVIGDSSHVCGMITIEDKLKDGAAESVARLKKAGIERVVMLTGDNLATAKAVADRTGVDETRAELLPEEKVAAIEELVKRHGTVAMVGDGVNDAPAMARASLGIAMGAVGSDAAIETADVALMSDELDKIAWLIEHSRRSLRVIRQNIFASLIVKAAFVVLAFTGKASLWSAIAADMGVSLLVIVNALRLLRPSQSTVEMR